MLVPPPEFAPLGLGEIFPFLDDLLAGCGSGENESSIVILLVVTGCRAFQQFELVAVGRELAAKRVMHAESS